MICAPDRQSTVARIVEKTAAKRPTQGSTKKQNISISNPTLAQLGKWLLCSFKFRTDSHIQNVATSGITCVRVN
jgi:hypothetical protein